MARHMINHQLTFFLTWKEFVKKNLRLKQLLTGHMAKIERKNFDAWKWHVKKNVFIREKIGKHLVGVKRDLFARWAKYTSTSLKIRVSDANFPSAHRPSCVTNCALIVRAVAPCRQTLHRHSTGKFFSLAQLDEKDEKSQGNVY